MMLHSCFCTLIMKADAAPETILFDFQPSDQIPRLANRKDAVTGGMSAGQF